MKTNKTVFIIASIILLFALYYKQYQQTDSKELIEGFMSPIARTLLIAMIGMCIVLFITFLFYFTL